MSLIYYMLKQLHNLGSKACKCFEKSMQMHTEAQMLCLESSWRWVTQLDILKYSLSEIFFPKL